MSERKLTGASAGYTDSDLIGRVLLRDDRNAFAELVRRHQSQLRASLRKMTGGNMAMSDDIAQESFILAWRNIKSFRYEAKFSTWLYRIAFNCWQSEVRRKHEVPMDGNAIHEAEVTAPESDLTGVRRDLLRAMEDLNDAERNVIVQCYYNDLSHEEAAYVLGMPLGTVKTHILKAREKMRAKLAAYRPHGSEGVAA
ncbi:MAG: sigma-70 family RNA polymerase sigma factor [Betaproteobacteria bacterium]